MNDDVNKIINDLTRVCKEVQPDLNAPDGTITALYKRTSFWDLFDAIGELYRKLVAFNIPTQYLNIDVGETSVRITLDYRGLKILCPVYGEEEQE